MKLVFLTALLVCPLALGQVSQLQCVHEEREIRTDPNWTDLDATCMMSVRTQIQEEINAAIQYLAAAAHFSRDTVNRPGFAKLFFDAASEEREHAIKLISYLLVRGELVSNVTPLIATSYSAQKSSWTTGSEALRDALQIESSVTKKIKNVIKVCEEQTNANDYNLVDYLAGGFLDEQYNGQRDLAGRVSVLNKFIAQHGALGEWLYDKSLQ